MYFEFVQNGANIAKHILATSFQNDKKRQMLTHLLIVCVLILSDEFIYLTIIWRRRSDLR